MIDREVRDVLGGCEPSSARTDGRSYPVLMGATEDAALRRLASRSATNRRMTIPVPLRPGARDSPINQLAGGGRGRRGGDRGERLGDPACDALELGSSDHVGR